MGGNNSKSTSDILNESITNVLMSNSSSCKQNNIARQNISITDINTTCGLNINGINQESTQTPNFSCSNNSSNNNVLMNELKNKLDQNIEQQLKGLNLGNENKNNISNKIKNIITNNIRMDNISKCVSKNFNSQDIIIKNINATCNDCNKPCPPLYDCSKMYEKCNVNIMNIGQKLTQNAVAKCMLDNKIINEAITTIDNDIKQKNKSILDGFNFDITASLGSLTSSFIPMMICLVLCMILSSSSLIPSLNNNNSNIDYE